jgi:hypothetical protein
LVHSTWSFDDPQTGWAQVDDSARRESEAALAIVSAVAVAALAVGLTHVLSRLRERQRSHAVSNRLLAQVFPRGLR